MKDLEVIYEPTEDKFEFHKKIPPTYDRMRKKRGGTQFFIIMGVVFLVIIALITFLILWFNLDNPEYSTSVWLGIGMAEAPFLIIALVLIYMGLFPDKFQKKWRSLVIDEYGIEVEFMDGEVREYHRDEIQSFYCRIDTNEKKKSKVKEFKPEILYYTLILVFDVPGNQLSFKLQKKNSLPPVESARDRIYSFCEKRMKLPFNKKYKIKRRILQVAVLIYFISLMLFLTKIITF